MGFVPIFITLGGFIFLFVMVVHQNLKRKKKEYFSLLEELVILNSEIAGQMGAAGQPPVASTLEAQELYLRELNQKFTADKKSEAYGKARKKLNESKLIRHQYYNLLQTKPYSFVARLLGHKPI